MIESVETKWPIYQMIEDELYEKFPYNENNCWDILEKIQKLENETFESCINSIVSNEPEAIIELNNYQILRRRKWSCKIWVPKWWSEAEWELITSVLKEAEGKLPE